MTQVVTGILIGAVVAAVGALVNYLLGLRRDRQRWDREDERQRERWNREDQQRREEWDHEHEFRDYVERRSAYSEFVASTDPPIVCLRAITARRRFERIGSVRP